MSGTWAREADAVQVSGWTDDHRLPEAVRYLGDALTDALPSLRAANVRAASALIRRERRALDPEGECSRRSDWQGEFTDDNLIWGALRLLATVDCSVYVEHKVWHLRMAEAAPAHSAQAGRCGMSADAEAAVARVRALLNEWKGRDSVPYLALRELREALDPPTRDLTEGRS